MRLGIDANAIADGYDAMMYARAIKTEAELGLLERATQLNQTAIGRTIAAWRPGFRWRDLGQAYARAATDLGGFVRDPGAMVWSHPQGADANISLQTGLEDGERSARALLARRGRRGDRKRRPPAVLLGLRPPRGRLISRQRARFARHPLFWRSVCRSTVLFRLKVCLSRLLIQVNSRSIPHCTIPYISKCSVVCRLAQTEVYKGGSCKAN